MSIWRAAMSPDPRLGGRHMSVGRHSGRADLAAGAVGIPAPAGSEEPGAGNAGACFLDRHAVTVDARDLVSRAGQQTNVPTRSAADVEYTLEGRQRKTLPDSRRLSRCPIVTNRVEERREPPPRVLVGHAPRPIAP